MHFSSHTTGLNILDSLSSQTSYLQINNSMPTSSMLSTMNSHTLQHLPIPPQYNIQQPLQNLNAMDLINLISNNNINIIPMNNINNINNIHNINNINNNITPIYTLQSIQ
eukprot:457401_1